MALRSMTINNHALHSVLQQFFKQAMQFINLWISRSEKRFIDDLIRIFLHKMPKLSYICFRHHQLTNLFTVIQQIPSINLQLTTDSISTKNKTFRKSIIFFQVVWYPWINLYLSGNTTSKLILDNLLLIVINFNSFSKHIVIELF